MAPHGIHGGLWHPRRILKRHGVTIFWRRYNKLIPGRGLWIAWRWTTKNYFWLHRFHSLFPHFQKHTKLLKLPGNPDTWGIQAAEILPAIFCCRRGTTESPKSRLLLSWSSWLSRITSRTGHHTSHKCQYRIDLMISWPTNGVDL